MTEAMNAEGREAVDAAGVVDALTRPIDDNLETPAIIGSQRETIHLHVLKLQAERDKSPSG